MLMQPEQPVQPTYVPPPVQTQNPGRFSVKQRRLLVVTGALLITMILVLILGAVFSGKQGPTEVSLTNVAARNSELLRMIDTFEDNLTTNEGKAYATQAKILLTSDNNQIIGYTKSVYGSSYSSKQVADTELQQTSNTLSERVGQNTFDSDFISTIQFEINLNKTILKQMDVSESQPNLYEVTSVAITNADSLL